MKLKNTIIAGLLALGVGVTSLTVYAQANYDSPREALSAMSGKTMDEIHELRFEEEMTHRDFFETEEQYNKFTDEVLNQRKDIIDERVEDGRLTQERADEIKDQMDENPEMFEGRGYGSGQNCHTLNENNNDRWENQREFDRENHHGARGRGFGHRR